jgi:carboxypeptidase T
MRDLHCTGTGAAMKSIILRARGLSAAALACCLAAAPAFGGSGHDHRAERAQERQRTEIFQAWFPDEATARRAAVSLHGQLLETQYARGFQVFELDADGVALLLRFGYRLQPASDFMRRRDAFLDAIEQANARRRALDPQAAEVGIQSVPGYACYETVEETFSAAQAIVATRPALASWVDVGDSWQKTAGSGGYDMRVLKLTNSAVAAAGGSKPRLFITSAIHAREYVTAPLSLAFARWLVDGHGNHADATWLLDHHEVHLMLHANPDGRKKAEAGLSWRKNTNTAYCGPRSSSRGADLNRNFSFGWNSTGGVGSSGNACSDVYRGPAPASEPEVKAVEAYIRSLWPDRRGPGLGDPAAADTSGIHIDLHSYSELVLWPWGSTDAAAPNGTALQTLGRRFAWFNGYYPQQSVGLYPTDGTSDGPSYGEQGVAAFTFELGTSFFQDCSSYENTIKPANLPALVYAAKVSRAPYQLPAGPDVTGITLAANNVAAGTPVGLTAALTATRFSQRNGTEPVLAVASAQAFIDTPPWAAGATPVPLVAGDGAFDSPTENAVATLSTSGLAAGRHTVFVRGVSASGQPGPVTAVFLDIGAAPPPAITLALTSTPINRRSWAVDLAWANAAGPNVDVYRNGALLVATANDGAYRDTRGRGTWTYRVCQTGSTSACSPQRTVSF